MTPPTALSARRGGLAFGTSWKNSTRGGGRFASISPPHKRGAQSVAASEAPCASEVLGGVFLTCENRRVVAEAHLSFVLPLNCVAGANGANKHGGFVTQMHLAFALPLNFVAGANWAHENRGFVAQTHLVFVLAHNFVAGANGSHEYGSFVSQTHLALIRSPAVTNHFVAKLDHDRPSPLSAFFDRDSQPRRRQIARNQAQALFHYAEVLGPMRCHTD